MDEKEKHEVMEQVPEQTPATTEKTPTARERYMSRYKEANPDLNMDDEESLYGAANGNLDELESYRKHNNELVSVFDKNKGFAAMLLAMKDNPDMDPIQWISENLGADINELLENEDYRNKISDALKKYHEQQAGAETSKKEMETNVQTSIQALVDFQKEKGLSNEECLSIWQKVEDIVSDGISGKVSPETFAMVMNAGNYEKDVANARSEGEVAGRNAKIQEQLKKQPENIPPTFAPSTNVKLNKKKDKGSFLEGVE